MTDRTSTTWVHEKVKKRAGTVEGINKTDPNDMAFNFFLKSFLRYMLLTSVEYSLSVLPTVLPKCVADKSPMCFAGNGFSN